MRGLFRTAVLLSLLICGTWIGLQAYLSSSAVTRQVAQRLESLLGMPVSVGSLELGASVSSAVDIHVFEHSSERGSAPFVSIGKVTADIGMTDILAGTAHPQQLTLENVHVTLRYDRDGHLLTRLPAAHPSESPLPAIHIANGSLLIAKQGDADCTIQNVDIDIAEKENRFTLAGQVRDPHWGGTWTISGSLPRPPSGGTLVLKNAGLHVTQEMLHRVPFVSADVWSHVALEGDTPVDLTLTLPPPPAPVGYRVTLAPKNTSVYVPSIDLRASTAHGLVVVEDNVVHLREVRGRVADGDLHVSSADLDYRGTTVMKFLLDAQRLDIRKLPGKWKLPPSLGGKLSGTANLVVRVIDGVAIPSGTGDGQVDRAMLGPIPIPNYGLRFQADRNGFTFQPRIAQ